ncbi:MAG: tetratricopeptide repeat protein [Proteobacteria bacterium]|nr:tetratricopeptide repeat protein [Pseudomonadota bacterium]
MRHPLFIIILLFAVNLFSGIDARAGAILNSITRSDDSARMQLTFAFDQIPVFNLATVGRRIDVVFKDAAVSGALLLPATDDKMIKTVSKVEKNGVLLSFYFRYPPQKATSESRPNENQIVLDILLGDRQSVSRPELAAPPQPTVAVRSASEHGPPNPVKHSKFAKDWRSFFNEYESPLDLLPAPRLFLPPFPLAVALPPPMPAADWLPEEALAEAREGKWFQVGLLLREQVARQSGEQLKERLVLTYAEAMIRAGDDREAEVLLQRIVRQYPDAPMAEMAAMLQIYLKACHGAPVDAYYEFRGWVHNNETSPLIGSYRLLLAELAILAHRHEDANKLLGDPAVTGDPALAAIRRLRQADLLAATGQNGKALAAYQELAGQSPLFEADPMSLARFANELYTARQYAEAAKRYQQLVDLLVNRPHQDLALFRLASAQLRIPATAKKARIDLQQVSNAFPGTEGGFRAQLKQTDVDFLAGKMSGREAATFYDHCANQASALAVREECAFKLALVKALSGEPEASVNQSMQVLRGFRSGKLRAEAMALLVQQFPDAIRRLVKNGDYVKAMVLADQNKHLFANGWIDTGPIYDLAFACNKLGLAEQTAEIYQYLFDISTESEQEKIYLPLIRSLSASGHYLQVEEYVNRYLTRYPKGADRPAVFAAKVLALYNSGQSDKALALMTDAASPNLREMELLKGRIYFDQQAWNKVVETLSPPELQDLLAQQGMLLPLAESYFRLDQNDRALPLFQRLAERNQHGSEQARFRLAQIAQRQNNRPQALKLFKDLAEKGTDPFWTKVARDEAALLELDTR